MFDQIRTRSRNQYVAHDRGSVLVYVRINMIMIRQSLRGFAVSNLHSGLGPAHELEVMSWNSLSSTYCMGYYDFLKG